MDMTSSKRAAGDKKMKTPSSRWYVAVLLLVALLIDENVVNWALAVKVGGYSTAAGFTEAFKDYSVFGYLFFTAFRLIPYMGLAIILVVLSKTKYKDFVLPVFIGGLIGILAMYLWGAWTTLRPLYTDERASSTQAIAFLILPFYSSFSGALGASALAAGYLPFRLMAKRRAGQAPSLPIQPPSEGTTTDVKTMQKNVRESQRIGIITCCAEKLADYFPTIAEPEFVPVEAPFTPDDQLLVDELRRLGHQVSAVIWGADTSELAGRYDRLIVRSPWDYMDSDAQRRSFLAWLEKLDGTGLPVENDLQVMLWLMDKRYLLDFAAVGVPIVPTYLVSFGEAFDLEAFAGLHGGVIVKPAVSAAGAGLEFLPDAQTARSFQQEFSQRCQSGAQLVQPFLPEIQTNGEWSLVYFRGEFSHGVHKCPARGQILVHAERGGSLRFAEPPDVVRELGDRAAAAVPQAFAAMSHGAECRMPLYLRVDVIETGSGGLVSECEGVEPELFFRARPGSAAHFAKLIGQEQLGPTACP
jgi:glutathione synthase/RimK-type ligase-like ATP-grasp enzyme